MSLISSGSSKINVSSGVTPSGNYGGTISSSSDDRQIQARFSNNAYTSSYKIIEEFDFDGDTISDDVNTENISQSEAIRMYIDFMEQSLKKIETEVKKLEDGYYGFIYVNPDMSEKYPELLYGEGAFYYTPETYLDYLNTIKYDELRFISDPDEYQKAMARIQQEVEIEYQRYSAIFNECFKKEIGMTYAEYNDRIMVLNQEKVAFESSMYALRQQEKLLPYIDISDSSDYKNYVQNNSNDVITIDMDDWNMGILTLYINGEKVNNNSVNPIELMEAIKEGKVLLYGNSASIVSNFSNNSDNFYSPEAISSLLQFLGFERAGGNSYEIELNRLIITEYDYLTDEEKSMYSYLFDTQGRVEADKYLEAIKDGINQRKGQAEAESFLKSISDENGVIQRDLWTGALSTGKGVLDGIETFGEGFENLFASDGVMTDNQYAQMYILSALGAQGIMDDAYQLGSSFGNMVPSMVASIVVSYVATPAVGSYVGNILMGMSSAGNAINQKKIDGDDTGWAYVYGVLTGVSETTLGLLLGNIGFLNSNASFSIKGLLSEGLEEAIQTYVEAGMNAAIYGEEFDISDLSEEAFKSFVYGVIMSGITTGGQLTVNIAINGTNVKITSLNEFMEFVNIMNDSNVSISKNDFGGIDSIVIKNDGTVDSELISKIQQFYPNVSIVQALSDGTASVLVEGAITVEGNSNIENSHIIDSEHGFQVNEGDFAGWYKANVENGFFSEVQVQNMLNNLNNKGYISAEAGIYFVSLFSDPDYNVYVKTVHSSDVDSIMQEGVRCLGTSTSGYGTAPTDISQINLGNTISSVDGTYDLISVLKNAYGVSQGGNPIDGTIIIKVPKGLDISDIVYFSEDSGTYCIKPKYIDCFSSVDGNGVVSDPMVNNTDDSVGQIGNKLNESEIDIEIKEYDVDETVTLKQSQELTDGSKEIDSEVKEYDENSTLELTPFIFNDGVNIVESDNMKNNGFEIDGDLTDSNDGSIVKVISNLKSSNGDLSLMKDFIGKLSDGELMSLLDSIRYDSTGIYKDVVSCLSAEQFLYALNNNLILFSNGFYSDMNISVGNGKSISMNYLVSMLADKKKSKRFLWFINNESYKGKNYFPNYTNSEILMGISNLLVELGYMGYNVDFDNVITDILTANSSDYLIMIDSELYSIDNGQSGSNQHSIINAMNSFDRYLKKDLIEQVKKYYPGISDNRARIFLFSINQDKGVCNYADVCNAIFEKYYGKESFFEIRFGFPMYRDGKLNDAQLLLDMFLQISGNKFDLTNFKSTADYINLCRVVGSSENYKLEYISDYLKYRGVLNNDSDITQTQLFNSSKKIGFNSFDINNMLSKINTSLKNGEHVSITGGEGLIFIPIDGGIPIKIKKGSAHIVSIYGIDSQGNLLVDSWGKTYKINLEATLNDNIKFTINSLKII